MIYTTNTTYNTNITNSTYNTYSTYNITATYTTIDTQKGKTKGKKSMLHIVLRLKQVNFKARLYDFKNRLVFIHLTILSFELNVESLYFCMESSHVQRSIHCNF